MSRHTVTGRGYRFDVQYLAEEVAPTMLRECEGDTYKRVVVWSRLHESGREMLKYRNAYCVFNKNVRMDDVIEDLHRYVDGEETLEEIFSYLSPPNLKRLISGGGAYTRYGEWCPTPVDPAGITGELGTWVLVAYQNRDSSIMDKELYGALLSMIEEGEGVDDSSFEIINFGHWGFGWVQVLIVEPESKAFECVKSILDADDMEEVAGLCPHFAVVSDLHMYVNHYMESVEDEVSPQLTIAEIKERIKNYLYTEYRSEDDVDKYTDVYADIFEEAGGVVVLE